MDLPQTTAVNWEYEDERGWHKMAFFYSGIHEQARLDGEEVLQYAVLYAKGKKAYHYEVDLTAMTQRNVETTTTRALRRSTRAVTELATESGKVAWEYQDDDGWHHMSSKYAALHEKHWRHHFEAGLVYEVLYGKGAAKEVSIPCRLYEDDASQLGHQENTVPAT